MADSPAESKEVVPSLGAVGPLRSVLKGMKIRDEFICPITYELLREPVVAADGHTYEKSAIEKWFKSNHTSPRSGEPIDITITIPNINLKKLIQDIINEGGAGFYTNDISNRDRYIEVCPEKVLILECLGPPESDWNNQCFTVSRSGVVGGRKHNIEDSNNNREIVLFKDITVSRRHFEITHVVDPAHHNMNYYIRDLGSAGGTFVRILFGGRKELQIGMIILLGKHQFTVSSIDDSGLEEEETTASPNKRGSITRRSLFAGNIAAATSPNNLSSAASAGLLRRSGLNSEVLLSLVKNAEMIIEDIDNQRAMSAEDKHQQDELSARLKSLTVELSSHLGIDAVADADADHHYVEDSKAAFTQRNGLGITSNELAAADAKDGTMMAAGSKHDFKSSNNSIIEDKDEMSEADQKAGKVDYSYRRCTLTCCAPDGSPLQGKSFIIGPDGATMGRKHTNAIPLYMKLKDGNGEERIANVDTAISSEHARVEFEGENGRFYIADGTPSKPSTNGTWFRLSGPHQESPPHLLSSGSEVLIGTVRFHVRESMTISERKVEEK